MIGRSVFCAAVLIIALGLASTPASAQKSTTRGFNIGAHLQGASLRVEGDEEDEAGGGGLGARVGYGFNRKLTGYLEVDGIVFDVENPDLEGEWAMAHVDLGLRY
ncbi:MAG TPA: outer membrane beta-barrel protein, partial [Longimicrobiales bacterium]